MLEQDVYEKLLKPFEEKYIQWRLGSTSEATKKGLVLAYLDARAVQRRLDEVFGWQNWTAEYRALNGTGVICRMTVRLGDEIVVKEDGADPTDIEATKGGISDAFKRVAASGFGIGRYLYGLPDQWVDIEPHGKSWRIAKHVRPILPAWALPDAAQAVREDVEKFLGAGATPPPDEHAPEQQPPTCGEMRRDLEDATWLTDAQLDSAYSVSGTPRSLNTQELTDTQLAALYNAALRVREEAAAGVVHESPPVGPPVCPKCGAPMKDKRKWGGKVAFKCSKSNWDKAARVERGCEGTIWQSEVDKHPEQYPAA